MCPAITGLLWLGQHHLEIWGSQVLRVRGYGRCRFVHGALPAGDFRRLPVAYSVAVLAVLYQGLQPCRTK